MILTIIILLESHTRYAAQSCMGGVVDQRPRVCILFFGKIKPLIIARVPVLIIYLVHFLHRPPIVTPTQGFVL